MKTKLIGSLAVTAVMWLVFLADFIFPGEFTNFGILPRTFRGLFGIILAPFLHAGLWHIVSNTLPILVLTFVLSAFYEKIAVKVWALSALIGGALVWLISWRNAIHVGMSGVIFSLLGFLLASGIFRKSLKSIIIGIIIFLLYGGALWGVIPSNPYVSWEGHLFGLLTGIFLAYIFRKEELKFKTDESFE